MAKGFWFHSRMPDGDKPGGVTVTKRKKLPHGEFACTEYVWADRSLWFLDSDHFTDNERQAAYDAMVLYAARTGADLTAET